MCNFDFKEYQCILKNVLDGKELHINKRLRLRSSIEGAPIKRVY